MTARFEDVIRSLCSIIVAFIYLKLLACFWFCLSDIQNVNFFLLAYIFETVWSRVLELRRYFNLQFDYFGDASMKVWA